MGSSGKNSIQPGNNGFFLESWMILNVIFLSSVSCACLIPRLFHVLRHTLIPVRLRETHTSFCGFDSCAGEYVYNVHARTCQKMELSGTSLSGYVSFILLLLFKNISWLASHGVSLWYLTPLLNLTLGFPGVSVSFVFSALNL